MNANTSFRLHPSSFDSSSWSSLECSPPCQGGDHGFKSRRVRLGRMTAEGGRMNSA
jgi:hypothetical protein